MKTTIIKTVSLLTLLCGCDIIDTKSGTPESVTDELTSKWQITESVVKFSNDAKLASLTTKEATLILTNTEKEETIINVRYAWANTGFELSLTVPEVLDDVFSIKEQTVSGVSKIWYDGGRSVVDYSGYYLLSASKNKSQKKQFSIVGEMSESFELDVLDLVPQSGETEREDSFVIVEHALLGYDVFENDTEKDITIMMTDSLYGENISIFIPQKSVIKKAFYSEEILQAYHGVDFVKDISIGFNGKSFPFYLWMPPFSQEARLSELKLNPVVLDGVLDVGLLVINTYIMPEEPMD